MCISMKRRTPYSSGQEYHAATQAQSKIIRVKEKKACLPSLLCNQNNDKMSTNRDRPPQTQRNRICGAKKMEESGQEGCRYKLTTTFKWINKGHHAEATFNILWFFHNENINYVYMGTDKELKLQYFNTSWERDDSLERFLIAEVRREGRPKTTGWHHFGFDNTWDIQELVMDEEERNVLQFGNSGCDWGSWATIL